MNHLHLIDYDSGNVSLPVIPLCLDFQQPLYGSALEYSCLLLPAAQSPSDSSR